MEKRTDIPTEYYNTDDSKKQEIQNKWWEQPEGEIHTHVTGVVKQIQQNQSYREAKNLRYARLYTNQNMTSLKGGDFARTGSETAKAIASNGVTWNVIKSAIDTLSSKIAKNKPRPMYLTDDKSFMLQRKAKNLTNFMHSQFMTMGIGKGDNRSLYGVGRQVFNDGCAFGLGGAKFYTEDGKIYAERVLPDEIIVDDIEGRYMQPQQLHQQTLMFKERVADLFPKAADKIRATTSELKGESTARSTADVIDVRESWHLRSGENAKDGKRVMSIENATLLAEPWEKDWFPFLFQRWTPNLIGWYGIGVAEELTGIQLEINKLLRRVAQAQHLMAVPQVWLEYQSKTVTSKLNNMIGGQRYYSGRPPVFLTPPSMNPEIYQHLDRLYNRAFEIVGISQLSAQGKKPSGLDSGKALREFQDIESERFALAQLRYEDFYMDAADLVKELLRDMAESGEDPVVNCRKDDGIETMRWKDVDIPDDRCSAIPYPTNFLSSTPAGKLQDAQELVQAGFFDRDEGLELLDFPDINAHKGEKLAPKQANRMLIEACLEGDYVTPEPFMDLVSLLPMAQNVYLRAKVKNVPEDRCELLRRLLTDTEAMLNGGTEIDEAMAPAMDPAMQDPMAGGPPMAQPEALPTSDLMPQV